MLALYFKFTFVRVQKNCRDLIILVLALESHLRVSLSLCTFFHLLLFNFQGPSLFAARFMRLIYYITFSSVCQEVFQKFFKFFQTVLTCYQVCLDATFILYHTFDRLSRGFAKVF